MSNNDGERAFAGHDRVALGNGHLAESDLPKVRAAADTRGVSLQGKLLVQGKYIAQAGEPEVVVVTVSPSAVDRKLTIRQMNERLEGKAPTSNTLPDTLNRR
jgi:hypothetical protein